MTLPIPLLALVLAGAGILAGIVSTVASLASLVSYPVRLAAAPPGDDAPARSYAGSWRTRLALFGVAVYVGYFGAAGGILLLAVLIRMIAEPLVPVNAVKNAVSGLANGVVGSGASSRPRA